LVRLAYLMQRPRCGSIESGCLSRVCLLRCLSWPGHELMCFCARDQACHADVLLELANP
jgi:hypothetical protein